MARLDTAEAPPGIRAVAAPEPDLTPDALVARAAALRPMLRAQQAEADLRGSYTDEVHQAFLDGGFYRVVQPRMFGGYEFDYPTFIRVIMEISRGHPSTGWCYTLATSHCYLVASHWPPEAQAELFGPDGDIRVCQRASPAGSIRRVDGGFEVDGVFGFCSGAPVCTHFIGASMLQDGDGPPRAVNFIAPRTKIEILDDWGGDSSLGMQGSGSNSIRLDRVFIPETHVVLNDVMTMAGPRDGPTPGVRLHGNPMYLGVPGGAFLTEFGAVTTGTARAALEEYERLMRITPMPRAPGSTRVADPEALRVLGRAMNMTDAAEAITLAAVQLYVDQCDRWARNGTPISTQDTMRIWGMSQEASKLACKAVDMMFETAGARASLGGQRMQRYFRDIQMYRVHTTAQPPFATLRAQAHMGLVP